MRKYILKRVLLMIPVLLGVSIIVFAVTHLFTTDPASNILGQHATEKQMEELRQKLGLHDPIHIQYWNYLKGVVRGDLGDSLFTQSKVTDEIMARFPATAELAVCAIIFASIVGVLIGSVSAVKKNSAVDVAGMIGSLIGISIPVFWLGIMLIILFGVILKWLPVSGRMDVLMDPPNITGFYLIDTLSTGNFEMFADAARHLVLPTVTLGMYSTAIIARMTRSSILETLEQDYVRTARAKGLTERAVVLRHALRNALIPVITVIGLQLGGLLGGAVLTETVYAWPGVGKYIVDSITKSDYPVVQGAVLLIAFIFVAVNLLVDILYAFLDPRIKYS